MTRSPLDTGDTTIEMPTEGHANGIIQYIESLGYNVEHDEERGAYVVGEFDG